MSEVSHLLPVNNEYSSLRVYCSDVPGFEPAVNE